MRDHIQFKQNKRNGFTLAEILVTIAILMGLLGTVAAFQSDVLNFNRSSSVALNNTFEAQRILRIMTKELRAAELSDAGSYPILAASTSSISFFSNVDSDVAKEQVDYYLTGTTLYRATINPTGSPPTYNPANRVISTVVTGIRNSTSSPVFTYFDKTYPTVANAMPYPINLTNVRLVSINLSVDTDPNKSPIPRTFSSQVQLRNLKDNL